MKRKIILTCAVTGENDYNRKHPNFPVTPEQIAEASLEASNAGASVVHLHVRDPETGEGRRDPALFKEMVSRVREKDVSAIINVTCGGGATLVPHPENDAVAGPGSDVAVSFEERVEHIRETMPEICSLDISTLNMIDGGKEYVYYNPAQTLREMARVFRDIGVKPEMELFNPGDVDFANTMIADGLVTGKPLFQMVLGAAWGLPSDPETMIYMRDRLPKDALWAALGIGRQQFPVLAQSILLGGNVRVGLEDNLYLERGVFATNGQLVERAVRIIEDLGCAVATPDEAREILGIEKRG